MDEKEALALMTKEAFQEEGEAVGKWRRARLTSAQLTTYFHGFTEMMKPARRARAKARLHRARLPRPAAQPRLALRAAPPGAALGIAARPRAAEGPRAGGRSDREIEPPSSTKRALRKAFAQASSCQSPLKSTTALPWTSRAP